MSFVFKNILLAIVLCITVDAQSSTIQNNNASLLEETKKLLACVNKYNSNSGIITLTELLPKQQNETQKIIFKYLGSVSKQDSSGSNLNLIRQLNTIFQYKKQYSKLYENEFEEILENLRDIYFNENCKSIKNVQQIDQKKEVDIQTIRDKLNQITSYYDYLLEKLFYKFLIHHGKLNEIDSLLSCNVEDIITSIETNSWYERKYKYYVHPDVRMIGSFSEVAQAIQISVIERIKMFYNNSNTESSKYLNTIKDEFEYLTTKYNDVNIPNNNCVFSPQNTIEKNTTEEKFVHTLYLSETLNRFLLSKLHQGNYAYSVIAINIPNSNKVFVTEDESYNHWRSVLKNYVSEDDLNKIENKLKGVLYLYNSDKLFLFNDLEVENKNIEVNKLCKAYLCSVGRGIIKDNEFQILYYIFQKLDDIIQALFKSDNISNIDSNIKMSIKIFTYMDMCPSCWYAWCKCHDCLERKCKDKIKMKTINFDSFELNISAHSIQPYVIPSNHPLVECISTSNNDNINVNDVNNWFEPKFRNKVRQSKVKFKNTNITKNKSYFLEQIVDLEGLNVLKEIYTSKYKIIKNILNAINCELKK